jgi:hypothetical protein
VPSFSPALLYSLSSFVIACIRPVFPLCLPPLACPI